MDFADLGWRDAMLVAVIGAGIYLVVALLRLAQLGRRRAPQPITLTPEPMAFFHDQISAPAGPAEPLVPPMESAPTEIGAPEMPSFGEQLARSAVEAEMRQMREELAALRLEVAELRAAGRVSPQYGDAMGLAQRGYGAQAIADRCGISLGEAELVLALSRDGANFTAENNHGGEPRIPAGTGRER